MKARLVTAVSAVALATFAAASAARAADPAAPHVDPYPGMLLPPPTSPAPVFTWTGLNVGVAAGYIGLREVLSSPGLSHTHQANGGLYSAGFGYDWQVDSFVVGLTTDIGLSTAKKNSVYGGLTHDTRLDSFGTVRGRFGFAIDRTLLYATGGFAWAVMHSNETSGGHYAANTSMRPGWTVGAGLEYAIMPEWTVRAEGLYAGLGLKTAVDSVLSDFKFRDTAALARLGANYKF